MKKIKIQVPASANAVMLDQYQDFMAGYEKAAESEAELEKHAISCFCNLDSRVIEDLSGKQVQEIMVHLTPMITRREWPLIRQFELNGIEFGFIPDLDESTYGEWVNIDEDIQNVNTWHSLMAILYRPIIRKEYDKRLKAERYQIAEHKSTKQYAEAMRLMPLDIVLGAIHFFRRLGIELLTLIPSYLEDQIASPEVQQLLSTSEENGSGFVPLINWPKEIH